MFVKTWQNKLESKKNYTQSPKIKLLSWSSNLAVSYKILEILKLAPYRFFPKSNSGNCILHMVRAKNQKGLIKRMSLFFFF